MGNGHADARILSRRYLVVAAAAVVFLGAIFRRVLKPERQRFYRINYEPDLDYAD